MDHLTHGGLPRNATLGSWVGATRRAGTVYGVLARAGRLAEATLHKGHRNQLFASSLFSPSHSYSQRGSCHSARLLNH